MKKLLAAFTFLLVPFAYAEGDDDLWESTGPHVRIKRNDHDGTHVVFKRTPDDAKLVKTTKDNNGTIRMTAVYYRNEKGFLTAGRIFDGTGNKLYRVRYGYDKNTGLLIAEDMFDSRAPIKRFDENGNHKEIPIRRIYYFYDAQGNQSKALALSAKRGKTAQEIFGKDAKESDIYVKDEDFKPEDFNRPDQNPFDQEKKRRKPQR